MDTARREGALPFDVPGVELGHHGDRCSFDAFLDKYRLTDPALHALARDRARRRYRRPRYRPRGLGALRGGQRLPRDHPRRRREHGAAVPGLRRALRLLPEPSAREPRRAPGLRRQGDAHVLLRLPRRPLPGLPGRARHGRPADRGGGDAHPARERGHDLRDPPPRRALRGAGRAGRPGRPHRRLRPGLPRHRAALADRRRGHGRQPGGRHRRDRPVPHARAGRGDARHPARAPDHRAQPLQPRRLRRLRARGRRGRIRGPLAPRCCSRSSSSAASSRWAPMR